MEPLAFPPPQTPGLMYGRKGRLRYRVIIMPINMTMMTPATDTHTPSLVSHRAF